MVSVVELVDTPDCGSEGWEIVPLHLPHMRVSPSGRWRESPKLVCVSTTWVRIPTTRANRFSGARGGTGLNRTQLGTKYGARKPHFYLNNTPIISNGQQLIDSVVPL